MSIAEITEATQHLTFMLDEEIFALDISKVRESPVVDLRLKFVSEATHLKELYLEVQPALHA